MASKDKKGNKFYEVTKERRASHWEITLISASIGATLGFFTAILVGACSKSATLDSIILISLMATVVGFLLGLGVAWIIRKYFSGVLDQVTHTADPIVPSTIDPGVAAPEATSAEPVKGSAVDYVFPEFSSDQR